MKISKQEFLDAFYERDIIIKITNNKKIRKVLLSLFPKYNKDLNNNKFVQCALDPNAYILYDWCTNGDGTIMTDTEVYDLLFLAQYGTELDSNSNLDNFQSIQF